MLCGGRSLVKHGDGEGVAVSLRCRAWTCPDCRPKRHRELVELAKAGTPNRFVTLTANPAVGVSPADRAAKLARAWRIVLQRFRRLHTGACIQYLAVFEATKRGEPHLHILVRGPYIDQRWLSNQMRQVMNSPIVDIRKIHSPRIAAAYVAKYVGKAPHRFATCKRYWYTQAWVTEEQKKKPLDDWGNVPWEIDDRPLWQLEQDWRAQQFVLQTTDEGALRYTIPPDIATFYPAWSARSRGG